ncbi:hypothetical protein JTE90_007545 [Oedothorax gibbosus]|uniref:Uncharacterized protein n=1 Tax=Oedothorax gibbosus TaxID=931172 RepID=A0AAV6VL41_9ARAC|nr:hypothetical protein JTE90_007545 [Oedothorax gibbosus]
MIQLVIGQIYFDTEGPIMDDKGRMIGVTDNSESLKIRWNLVIKQGKSNKTTITHFDWKPKDEKDKGKPPIDEMIPDNKDKDKDKTPIDEKVPGDKDDQMKMIPDDIDEKMKRIPDDKDDQMKMIPDDKNKDKTPLEEKIPNNKDKTLTPAPLVQVYVVASGNGGAHTNIGDGGYYGRNNGYALSTGSATEDGKNKWSGGFSWDEKDWKDAQPRIPSQDWTQSSSWRIEDQKDINKHIAQIDGQSGGGGMVMSLSDDKLGEASTKYRISYLGLNLKPQSLAARTREKLLNWRLRFRK